MKVISSTGGKVGLLCPRRRQFWVFKVDPIKLICTGEFHRQRRFQRGCGDAPLIPQAPPPRYSDLRRNFHASAISDDFLAIGCRGIIMIFFLDGDEAGCWVTTMKLNDDAITEHLTFSPDGQHVAALVRDPAGYVTPPDGNQPAVVRAPSGYAILIFDTASFPKEGLTREDHFEPFMAAIDVSIPLNSFSPRQPTLILLSPYAKKIAVSTTLVDNLALLQLYRKTGEGWQGGQICSGSVFPHDDPTTWHGRGITGMELYNLKPVGC